MDKFIQVSHISKTKFKAKVLEFFQQIEKSGKAVIVTDRGNPVLEIYPYQGDSRDPLDVLRGSVLRYVDPTDSIDLEWGTSPKKRCTNLGTSLGWSYKL